MSLSQKQIEEEDLEGLSFSILSAQECSKYQKVAQKQKKDYVKFLKNKKHIRVKDLIAKRKEKTQNKMTEQFERQQI